MAPVLAAAFFTAGIFAFLAWLDNDPISVLLTHARTETLPIQMLQLLEDERDPSIAAMSTCPILLTVAVLLAGDLLVGLRRLAEL